MRIWRIQTSPRIWKRSINRRRIGSVQPARWKRRTFALLRSSLDQYFLDLNGSRPHDIYKMIVACVEKPMLEYLLERAQGNQSQAAESLGINRNTLRKKLQLYGLLK